MVLLACPAENARNQLKQLEISALLDGTLQFRQLSAQMLRSTCLQSWGLKAFKELLPRGGSSQARGGILEKVL